MMGGGRQTISITQCSHCCSTSSCCPLMCRHHRRIPPKNVLNITSSNSLPIILVSNEWTRDMFHFFLPVPTTVAYHQLYVQINYVRTVHNWSIRSDHLFKVSQQLCINILTNCLQQRKCNYIYIYSQLNALQLNVFFWQFARHIIYWACSFWNQMIYNIFQNFTEK